MRRHLKYYIFDWDDNILHMPTRIFLEHRAQESAPWQLVALPTDRYVAVRTDSIHYRLPPGGKKEAFRDFSDPEDLQGESAFLRDTRTALQRVVAGEKPGPSFEALRKTLKKARIFAIVTSRGHAPSVLRKAVELFVETILSPEDRAEMLANIRAYRLWLDGKEAASTDEEDIAYYLSLCGYYAVMSASFKRWIRGDERFAERFDSTPSEHRVEMAKTCAICDFTEKLFKTLRKTGDLNCPISVGFSDDDPGNVKAVSDFMKENLMRRFPDFKFVLYDTSDRTFSHGRKIVVSEERK